MKIIDKCAAQKDETLFICDYSPLKSAGPETWEPAQNIAADYICVAYNPGKAVRVNNAFLAHAIELQTGRKAIFNLSPRDMNKLALQSLLLGANLIGLENVVVLQGDPFSEKQLENVKDVSDFRPTELIQAISDLNKGIDYKGLKLQSGTDLCVGATMDLGRGIKREASLTHKKSQAGAEFFLTQPVFSPMEITDFEDAYREISGEALTKAVFWGLQIFIEGGVIFSNVPETMRNELEKGRDGVEIALEQLEALQQAGINRIYLIPPIMKGGRRDYSAAQRLLSQVR